MFIFIDESGPFVIPSQSSPALSCVGALIVPDSSYPSLRSRLGLLKQQWGVTGEVKGSKLNEPQVFDVITTLLDHDCKFVVCCTDMSAYSPSQLEAYRDQQAQGLIANLTEQHHSSLRSQLLGLKQDIEQMPYQLFIQSRLLTELLIRVLQEASLVFCRRRSSELASFKWIIDSKDLTKTRYERCWELIAGGIIQSFLILSPLTMLEGGDYRYLFSNYGALDQRWPRHLPPPRTLTDRVCPILDLRKLLFEELTFEASETCEGLQFVDVITNTFRRAAMGRLRYSGWCRMGELMMRLKGDAVGLFQLSHDGLIRGKPLPKEIHDRLKRLESKARLALDC
jgi:Protein of unknown function (DUF3800)